MNDNKSDPKMPEPLGSHRIHTPAEVRAHKLALADYWASIRAKERAEADKIAAEKAHANRYLSEQEAYELAVERDNANRAKQLEREVAALAKEQERVSYLKSTPDTAEICTGNPVQFLQELETWHHKGYSVYFPGPLVLSPNFFHLTLHRAEPAKKAKG
jgi:hypothetical protein